jgi:DUF1680 family protein
MTVRQHTSYPWEGTVRLSIALSRPTEFELALRMPGWCRDARLRINGAEVDLAVRTEKGYLRTSRVWSDGDTVELDLAMPVERVYAHPEVKADVGCVALQRGPLVYCVEEVDNPVPLHRLSLAPDAQLAPQQGVALPDGTVCIKGEGQILSGEGWDGRLYRDEPPALTPYTLTAVPYFFWDNRGAGQMRVWLRETSSAGSRE